MTSTGTSTSVDCCGRVACVGGLAPGPPPSLDPPDRRREWSVAPPTPSIAVLPCLVAGLPLSRCCLACCIVVALVRFIAHGDSRPGDRVQCLSAPTGGGAWKVQHGCHRCCSSAPGFHPRSGLPSPSRGEPRPYMAIAYALPSTVLSDELTARPDPTAHPPHRTKRYQGSLVSTLAAATGPRFAGPTSIPAEH